MGLSLPLFMRVRVHALRRGRVFMCRSHRSIVVVVVVIIIIIITTTTTTTTIIM